MKRKRKLNATLRVAFKELKRLSLILHYLNILGDEPILTTINGRFELAAVDDEEKISSLINLIDIVNNCKKYTVEDVLREVSDNAKWIVKILEIERDEIIKVYPNYDTSENRHYAYSLFEKEVL